MFFIQCSTQDGLQALWLSSLILLCPRFTVKNKISGTCELCGTHKQFILSFNCAALRPIIHL